MIQVSVSEFEYNISATVSSTDKTSVTCVVEEVSSSFAPVVQYGGRGEKGDVGDIGPQGPQGDRGPQGDPGDPNLIDVQDLTLIFDNNLI